MLTGRLFERAPHFSQPVCVHCWRQGCLRESDVHSKTILKEIPLRRTCDKSWFCLLFNTSILAFLSKKSMCSKLLNPRPPLHRSTTKDIRRKHSRYSICSSRHIVCTRFFGVCGCDIPCVGTLRPHLLFTCSPSPSTTSWKHYCLTFHRSEY